MDRRNVDQGTCGSNPSSLADIRRARLRQLALGWLRFLRFLELQRRMDAGEPVLRIAQDDPAG